MLRLHFTKEEKSELDTLTKEYQKITASLKKPKTALEALNMFRNNVPLGKKKDLDALDEILQKTAILRKEAINRALKYYSVNLDELVSDIKEHLQFSIQATYFLLNENENLWKENILNSIKDYLDLLQNSSTEHYKEIETYIENIFKNKDNFAPKITLDGEEKTKAGNKPKNNELELYTPSPLAIMFSGKATNILGKARTKGKFDPATRALTIEGVNIFSTESVQKIGVGTAKIFRYAVAEFTKRNHQNATGDKINSRIFLDVEDFAIANGVDITSTDAMKNFRRKIKNSLNILLTSNITWTEKIKGKEKSYSGMNYIGKYDLDGNTLRIEFTISMAEYLASLPLINYPRSLYKLDDRDFNAFAIGEAMCIHYSQDNNVIRQTEGKLRVETLLKCTSFPTYDELKAQKRSWEERVKEPFENALDHLTKSGFLKEWKYCYEGGTEIADDEIRAGIINSYEKFISLIIKFELNDYKESKIRAIEIKEKKAEKIKKIKTKPKIKEKTDND